MDNLIMYSEVLALGFQRKLMDDKVFFNAYGYAYFTMGLIIHKTKKKKIKVEWDCTTRKVRIISYDKEGSILEKRENLSLEELKISINILKLFTK